MKKNFEKMALQFSDTRTVKGEPAKRGLFADMDIDYLQSFFQNENEAISGDLSDDKNNAVVSPIPDEKSQQEAAQQATSQKSSIPSWLIEIDKAIDESNKLIEANKPVYNIDREKQLQRVGRLQKYTDAFTVLAQAIGASAGASVPQMQLNNSAYSSQMIERLRDAHENDEKRYNMLALQEKLRGINTIADATTKHAMTQEANVEARNRLDYQKQKEIEVLQERERIANDPNSFENRIKREKQDNDNRESEARAKYYEAGVTSRNAYGNYQAARAQNVGAGTTGGKAKAYMYLYDNPNADPVAQINDEGQLRAYYQAIINDESIKDEDVEALRFQTDAPSANVMKDVVSRHWRKVHDSMPDSSENNQSDVPAYFQDEKNINDLDARLRWFADNGTDVAIQKKWTRKYLIDKAGMTADEAEELINRLFE